MATLGWVLAAAFGIAWVAEKAEHSTARKKADYYEQRCESLAALVDRISSVGAVQQGIQARKTLKALMTGGHK